MQIQLTGGAYQAKSVVASAQRCVNLYPEINEQGAPFPTTHYLTPGLTQVADVTGPQIGWRGLFVASNGRLYGVCGPAVYWITPGFIPQKIGTISSSSGMVSMADNGTDLLLVDGSTSGWWIHLASNAFSAVSDPSFYGGSRVALIDGFFVLNSAANPFQWYISDDLATTFTSTNFAGKTGYSDPIVCCYATQRNLWIFGTQTTEIWVDAGNADFPFERLPGPFLQVGCASAQSIGRLNETLIWLGLNENGRAVAMASEFYTALPISTRAIENTWQMYPTVADAQACTYQQDGHQFYVLNFPTANATWVYDLTSNMWHERAYNDANGAENRVRYSCIAFYNNAHVAGDWQTGQLYILDPANPTDNGQPIVRRRGLPVMQDEGVRLIYRAFVADMDVGEGVYGGEFGQTLTDAQMQIGVSPASVTLSMQSALTFGTSTYAQMQTELQEIYTGPEAFDDQVYLRWSDDRGKTWGNPLAISIGQLGEFLTSLKWRRLGYARNRVFELFWACNAMTALNGAYVDAQEAAA